MDAVARRHRRVAALVAARLTQHRRDLLQNSRTFAAALQRAFQRFGLPFIAAHPRQQLLLISVGMAHHFRLIVIYYTGV